MKTLRQLLDIKPATLAREQADALQDYAVQRLRFIADLLEHRQYEDVKACLFYSPSGDCMGLDSMCIHFDMIEENMDLGGVVGMIEHLEGLAKEKDQ